MNFEATNDILNVVGNYIDLTNITVSAESKDGKGRTCQFDSVVLIEEQNVHFEVFDNEIIIGYFSDHIHFEDYSCELEKGDPDYLVRAKELLIQLFTLPVRHAETRKGNVLTSERYSFVLSDQTEDCFSGLISYHVLFGFNPFAKKTVTMTTWQYDIQKKCFTTRPPWKADPEAIEVVRINDDCYIEIFRKNEVYSYQIEVLDFDDYYGSYCWIPMDDGRKSLFDTKEKALQAAKAALTPHRTKNQER